MLVTTSPGVVPCRGEDARWNATASMPTEEGGQKVAVHDSPDWVISDQIYEPTATGAE